jgi:hypothetical protein
VKSNFIHVLDGDDAEPQWNNMPELVDETKFEYTWDDVEENERIERERGGAT